jgi:histidinol-phosphatase (PHP family)
MEYIESLTYFKKAYKYGILSKEKSIIKKLLFNISLNYKKLEEFDNALEYLDEYIELTRLGSFDVLGHIGYPLRYMRTIGFDISLEPFTEKLSVLFKELMLKGKGIELNTSGLRKWLNEPLPAPFILRLYRELGGEIITLGSDAHRPEDTGADIRKCLILLKELGYKYYCVYSQRKPEFIKIGDVSI